MDQQPTFWIDGALSASLSLPDRGLDYGDGLFETLLLCRGTPLYLEYHLQRLDLGLQALSMPPCTALVREYLQSALDDPATKTAEWAALRLTVTRGAGPRGYAPPINAIPRIFLQLTPLDRACDVRGEAADVALASLRLATQPALAGIKHLNRLEQVLAAQEAQAKKVDEVVVLDHKGEVVSVAAGNLFAVCEGEIITPSLHDCGVVGTRRRLIIERWGPAAGYPVREASLTLQDIRAAQELFYSNSLWSVRPIGKFESHSWSEHSVCNAVFNQFLQELA